MRLPAVITLALLLAAGCGGPSSGGKEIVFWAFGAEGEHVAKLIPGFEREHPGITVRVQMIPWNAAHEKLLTAYAGNSLPDLCQLGNTWIPEFQMLQALDNLDPWVKNSRLISAGSYFPGIWDTNIIDSLLYGVPWYVDTRVLFYRIDFFRAAGYDRPPVSWDEWFDLSRKIVRRRIAQYGVFFSTNNEWVPQVVLALQKGSPLLKDNGLYGDFSGPQFRDAMGTFHRFFTEGLAPIRTTQIMNIYQALTDSVFAMLITGPWNIGEFRNRLPAELQDQWMTASLPGPDGATGVSLAGGSSLVMFSTSTKKDIVWKLIEYLSRPDVQSEFYRLTGDLPARTEAWGDTLLSGNKYTAAIFEQLRHVVPTPKIPEWEQIAQKIRAVTEQITMDRMSVDDATAELDRSVNLMLEKRRWMVQHGR